MGSGVLSKFQGSSSKSAGLFLPSKVQLSISIPPEVAGIREDLESIGVLSLRAGQISEKVLEEAIPSILNASFIGPITPINDDAYLLPMASLEEVK